jgi:D-alanyl-D-alanine dipeptidase
MIRTAAIARLRAAYRHAWIAAVAILAIGPAYAESQMPASFAYLRDIDPSIKQDIRYASSDNFMGQPMVGYDAAECILRRDVALALQRVQADLAAWGFALKVYDCYRPTRAVRAMANWAHDGAPVGANKRFFPRAQKANLFTLGYIASVSLHSTGTAIDLTLIEAGNAPPPPFDPAAHYAPCTAPASEREPDDSIDMGTGYDCLDVNSYTASAAISAEQRQRRRTLVAAMAKRGFRNYAREWWHFSFSGTTPPAPHDFPIAPRGAKAPSD